MALICIKALYRASNRKYPKRNEQLLVPGKCLNLEVWVTGEKLPSWGETRLSDTRSSHPGQESLISLHGWGTYPPVTRDWGEPGGVVPPGWSTNQVGSGLQDLEWIFFWKPYCGVNCSQGLHFPAADCGAWGDGTEAQQDWMGKDSVQEETEHMSMINMLQYEGNSC